MLRRKLFVLCISIVVLFSSCTQNETVEKKPVQEIIKDIPSNYNKGENDKVSVDAEVEFPDTEQYGIIAAKDWEFNKNEILEMFFPGKEYVQESQTTFITDDKEEIYFDSGTFTYKTKLSEYIFAVFSYTFRYSSPGTEEKFTKESLTGFTKEEAIATGKKAIEKLGISVAENPVAISLDAETLQKEQDLLLEDSFYQTLIENNKIEFKETWEEDDECYFLVFSPTVRNIPILPMSFNYQSKDVSISGSQIAILVSKDGIESFEIHDKIYQEVSLKEQLQELVTMEYAIQKFEKKFGALLMDRSYKVKKLQMVYVPVQENLNVPEYDLIPTWELEIEIKYTGTVMEKDEDGNLVKSTKTSYSYNIFLVNAVTGEEII